MATLDDILSKFPNADQLDVTNMLLAAIASNMGDIKLTGWADLQELVRLNLHKQIQVGDAFTAERESTLVASKGDSTGITAISVDANTFLAAVGEAHEGVYEATYDGAAWHKENGESFNPTAYGITLTGTPVAGDHFTITETTSKLIFDVVDHDKDCAADERSIVLLSRNVVNYDAVTFDAPELMFYTATALPAGMYKFTLDHGAYANETGQDGTYVFTTTKAIPAGGGFRHSTAGVYNPPYSTSQITSGKITTYGAAPERTVQESNISCALYSSQTATDLGKFTSRNAAYLNSTSDATTHNFTERVAYGSNRYAHSAARQWLNSSAASNWWVAKNNFDMPPAKGNNLPGFLYGLDPALIDAIGEATIVCSMPDPDRTAGSATSETLRDKVFLPSLTEIFGDNNISIAEGSKYAYYNGAGNAQRIKYQGSTARVWWMRSAYPGNAGYVRGVSASGALSYFSAFSAFGLVPGLIIKSKI